MKHQFSIYAAIFITLVLACQAFGQGPGGYRTWGSASGFGNILFPGTGNPPNLNISGNGAIWRPAPSFGDRLSANIQGRTLPSDRSFGHGRTVVVPYAVPVYYGGGYYPQQPDPNVTVIQQPPVQQSAPPVIINQYYSSDGGRSYVSAPPTAPSAGNESPLRVYEAPVTQPQEAFQPPAAKPARQDDKPIIYLVAFKSGAIYPTLAYWVEGDTLQYITMDKSLNKANLELVDRDLSLRLNSERHVEFSLPAAK